MVLRWSTLLCVYLHNPCDPCFDRKGPYFVGVVVQNRGHDCMTSIESIYIIQYYVNNESISHAIRPNRSRVQASKPLAGDQVPPIFCPSRKGNPIPTTMS